MPILAKGQTVKGHIWTYVRDDRPFCGRAPPAALYYASRDRRQEHPTRHLQSFSGILQADAFSGYNELYDASRAQGPITSALCWAHARRQFFELADIARKSAVHFDLLLVLDVVEHVEDYFSLLRAIKPQGDYKILHIPLDLSVESVLRGHPILQRRDQYGHIHYFTKDLALRTLEDMGYRVLDHLYTRERRAMTARGRCLKGLRTALFRLQPDLAARLIGGFRLMVLAR